MTQRRAVSTLAIFFFSIACCTCQATGFLDRDGVRQGRFQTERKSRPPENGPGDCQGANRAVAAEKARAGPVRRRESAYP